jgi:hypothetical protein
MVKSLLQAAQIHRDSENILGGTIMQFACNPAAFFVLESEKARSQLC